jgi:hypothetical protein
MTGDGIPKKEILMAYIINLLNARKSRKIRKND